MFEELASSVLRDGLRANSNAEELWRVAEEKQRNAEIMIWAVLAGCTVGLANSAPQDSSINEDRLINVTWPDQSAFGDLLHRVSRQAELTAFSDAIFPTVRRNALGSSWVAKILQWSDYANFDGDLIPTLNAMMTNRSAVVSAALADTEAWVDLGTIRLSAAKIFLAFNSLRSAKISDVTAPIMRCFAFLNGRGVEVNGQIICGIDLRHADLSGAHFDNASLLYCALSNTTLQKATFRNATLDNTLFHRADLSESVWQQAKFRQTVLSEALVKDAVFNPQFSSGVT